MYIVYWAWRSLYNNKELHKLVIISVILMTLMFDLVVIH